MAQIVTITEQSQRKDIQYPGDILEIQNDDVLLTGRGYATFNIIKVEGMTAQEVKDELNKLLPEIDSDPETGKEYWNQDGTWREIVIKPKYSHTAQNLLESDILALASPIVDKEIKQMLLFNTCEEKIHLFDANLVSPERPRARKKQ